MISLRSVPVRKADERDLLSYACSFKTRKAPYSFSIPSERSAHGLSAALKRILVKESFEYFLASPSFGVFPDDKRTLLQFKWPLWTRTTQMLHNYPLARSKLRPFHWPRQCSVAPLFLNQVGHSSENRNSVTHKQHTAMFWYWRGGLEAVSSAQQEEW